MKRIITAIAAFILAVTAVLAPVSASGFGDETDPLPVIAGGKDPGVDAALVIDLDSGAVIYERNGDVMFKPGSLTVIMTSLMLVNSTPDSEWDKPLPALTEVNSTWSSRGSQMGLKRGDTPTRRDLLYGMLLQGAADAAYVAELLISGSEADFIDRMNEYAAELGLTATHFENGYGMGGSDHYTCAYDMGLLSVEAMKSDVFSQAAGTLDYKCSKGCRRIKLHNSNRALYNESCKGIKLGSDSEKEHCLVAAAKYGTVRLAAVILSAQSDSAAYREAERLLTAGITAYGSTCGLSPFLPTDALCRTVRDTYINELSGKTLGVAEKGSVLRICGTRHEEDGTVSCFFKKGKDLVTVKGGDLELVAYVNDIFIENGEGLSREIKKGDTLSVKGFVRSRHEICGISVVIRDKDGKDVIRAERAPRTHGVVKMNGTEISKKLRSAELSEGVYECIVTVTANASAEGFGSAVLTSENRSTLSVSSGGECVSYNANMGSGAPSGESFFGGFTVPDEVPERTGFVFDGWYDNADGEGDRVDPGHLVYSADPVTLYAAWKPADSAWEKELRALYDAGLIIEGTASNNAGITGLRLEVFDKNGLLIEREIGLCVNSIDPGSVLFDAPAVLDEGNFVIRLFGSAAGAENELLLEQELKVTKAEASVTPVPTETEAAAATAAPEPVPEGSGGLASMPIYVWFLVGAAIVAILVYMIAVLLKRG